MRNHFKKNLITLFVFFVAFLITSCRERTDEKLILELMEKIGSFVEKKDISNIMLNLADNYYDFEGRGKSKTQDMIQNYFKEYKGIVIHVLSTRIDEIKLQEAFIQTEVALSSGAAKVFRKLIKYSTENYRLKIKLIKRNGKWQIQYAEWRYVRLKELFPESLSILKKIFVSLRVQNESI